MGAPAGHAACPGRRPREELGRAPHRRVRRALSPDHGARARIRCLQLGILCTLHRLGFGSLTGIDLNPRVRRMPFWDRIRWEVGNFLSTPFPNRSFDAITSISVIEHGFDADALLRESARLLEPGGWFVASFDYWPEKIDTSDTTFFGLDWRIFSRAEVEDFVRQARGYGFAPAGPLALDASERTVSGGGRHVRVDGAQADVDATVLPTNSIRRDLGTCGGPPHALAGARQVPREGPPRLGFVPSDGVRRGRLHARACDRAVRARGRRRSASSRARRGTRRARGFEVFPLMRAWSMARRAS